jgi:hypothetical protein
MLPASSKAFRMRSVKALARAKKAPRSPQGSSCSAISCSVSSARPRQASALGQLEGPHDGGRACRHGRVAGRLQRAAVDLAEALDEQAQHGPHLRRD